MLTLLLVAGCNGQQEEQKKKKNEELQRKIDELERQKEQEKLQQQIDDLKEEQREQGEQNQEQPDIVIGTSAPEGRVVISPHATFAGTDQEAAALKAAIAYYEAAERGDYRDTYNALPRGDQQKYAYAESAHANEELDTAAGEFVIYSVEETPGPADHVRVGLTVYPGDGSSFVRYTNFIYERGAWRHSLTREEYELFDSVL